MAITRSFKVYGRDGHRIKESFNTSYTYDFSNDIDGTRIISVMNQDITGTNEYCIVKIIRDTAEDCIDELNGQISDGIFENQRTGRVEEINA